MARDPAVDELLKICHDIHPKILWAFGEAEPLHDGDGGRLKARIELADGWCEDWLPLFKAAEESCPAVSKQIASVREALANAIIIGGPTDIKAVAPAIRVLQGVQDDSDQGAI